VGQKERIKELAKNIDVLNMTATPIPRTLHMALSGIRHISVIETPPEERLAVKTTVTVFDSNLIRDAISRELERDGQVFFVHNRVSDIYRMGQHIQALVPEARLAVAHGQMPEKELSISCTGSSKEMSKFSSQPPSSARVSIFRGRTRLL